MWQLYSCGLAALRLPTTSSMIIQNSSSLHRSREDKTTSSSLSSTPCAFFFLLVCVAVKWRPRESLALHLFGRKASCWNHCKICYDDSHPNNSAPSTVTRDSPPHYSAPSTMLGIFYETAQTLPRVLLLQLVQEKHRREHNEKSCTRSLGGSHCVLVDGVDALLSSIRSWITASH